ncbi:MAG TPA: hypothetical protein VGL69_13930 [Solirubrobacteraceae bacterium]|jgi:uncharacterized glyoxalase superfamily protein PhnB
MSITPHIVVQGAAQAVSFYEDAFGAQEMQRKLVDPFGHRWKVGQHLRDVPHDEQAAVAALFGEARREAGEG